MFFTMTYKYVHSKQKTNTFYAYKAEGKVIPLQARCGPEGG